MSFARLVPVCRFYFSIMYIPGHSDPQIYFPCGRMNMFATCMFGNL